MVGGEVTIAVIANVVMICGMLALAMHRLYVVYIREGSRNGIKVDKVVLTIILVLIAYISLLPGVLPFWFQVLGGTIMHMGDITCYFSVDERLNKRYQNMLTSKITLITFFLSIITLFLGYTAHTSVRSFISNEPPTPTLTYYAYHALFFFIVLYMCLLIASRYAINLRQPLNAVAKVSALSGMVGFLIGAGCFVLVELNLYYSVFYSAADQQKWNAVFSSGLVIHILFILISFVLPPVYTLITHHLERRQLRYLHRMLVSIVPFVQLPGGEKQDVRILTEIGDARRAIGTSVLHSAHLSASEEADAIWDLFSQRVTLAEPGSDSPYPRPTDTYQHYLAVARCLKGLEQRRGASTGKISYGN